MIPETADKFIGRVRACIEAHSLLARVSSSGSPKERVVVGVSGGPDSVALLLALNELARAGCPMDLVAAHLHHGLRAGAADADQSFVEGLARQEGVPVEGGRADVRAEGAKAGIGIEEAARIARRRFLTDVARRVAAKKVALAHHADDRAETVLFHILRGTGVEGLAALAPRAPLAPDEGIEIVRPLIDVTRADVLAFLEARGQDWREDETNTSQAHTRNRIRHDLLPLLRKGFNRKVDEALVRLADQAAAASEVLADVLDAVWQQIVREVPERKVGALHPPPDLPGSGGCGAPTLRADKIDPRGGQSSRQVGIGTPRSIVIDADDFEALRPWMQGAIVRRAIERLGGGLKHMSAERTQAVVDALLSKSVAGPVDLPDGLVAERRRRAIRIGRRRA